MSNNNSVLRKKRLRSKKDSSIKFDTIKNYVNSRKSTIQKEQILLEKYVEKIDVDDANIKSLLDLLLNDKNPGKFYDIYEKFLFQLSINDRLYYQSKINSRKDLSEFIKKNFINVKEMKIIFKNICIDIINTDVNNIKNIFEKNGVYFIKKIYNIIPNKLGTNEFQYYCLLNDIFYYFDDNRVSFDNKKEIFSIYEPIIVSLDELNDYEIITIFNYLVNILYIYLDQTNINMLILYKIVNSCLPFNQNKAKSLLLYLKQKKRKFLKINNKYPYEYDEIQVKENDMIYLEINKIAIKIEAKNVNWNFHEIEFEINLKSGLFMFCIRYPYNCKYNYFTINEKIDKSLDSLFNKMINSDPVKVAMMSDVEANNFEYLFQNKDILNEFKDNIHLVVFPFENYHGYSDKKSFDIYLNIYINLENDLFKVFQIFESFLISKCHEYKNCSRIYMRIFGNSELKTPRISFSSKELEKRINESSSIISSSSANYPKDSVIFKKSTNEYGESFEIALFGYKVEILFLKSIIFCLDESSWDLKSTLFYEEFKKTMIYKNPIKIEEECKKGLAKLIYQFFDFSKRNNLSGNIIINNKSYNLSDNNFCRFISFPKAPHHLTRNEEGKDWR